MLFPVRDPTNVSALTNNSVIPSGNGVLCDLTQGYSFILQSVLGVLAFSTLILKRFREPKDERRPFWIWLADTMKQALGMLEMHFVNLALSAVITTKHECISYLVSFLLDSTIGLLLIFFLLKVVARLVHWFDIKALRSGEYGDPFQFHYWLAQCGVYLAVVLVEKLIVGPLVAFQFWVKVENVILPRNEHLRIAIVIFIVPFAVNVIMFWIVDSILMRKRQSNTPVTDVHYHRQRGCSPRYGKLGSESDSCLSCSEGETERIIIQETTLSSLQDRTTVSTAHSDTDR